VLAGSVSLTISSQTRAVAARSAAGLPLAASSQRLLSLVFTSAGRFGAAEIADLHWATSAAIAGLGDTPAPPDEPEPLASAVPPEPLPPVAGVLVACALVVVALCVEVAAVPAVGLAAVLAVVVEVPAAAGVFDELEDELPPHPVASAALTAASVSSEHPLPTIGRR